MSAGMAWGTTVSHLHCTTSWPQRAGRLQVHALTHMANRAGTNTLGLQVFAPLARMLGLHMLVVELEDLSFAYSRPDDHRILTAHLKQHHAEQLPALEQVGSEFLQLQCMPDPGWLGVWGG